MFRPTTKLGLGVAIGLAFTLWPVLIVPLVIGIRLLVPDGHAIGELMGSFGFGLLILIPLSLICSAVILLICGMVWGIGSIKSNARGGRHSRSILGAFCASTLLIAIYVPTGPDPCSRSFTQQGYEDCVSDMFAEMSVQDARNWLEAQGYKNTRIIEPFGGNRDLKFYSSFSALRNYGPYYSIAYGTNFFRLFGRIPPAPSNFELVIKSSLTEDRVVSVQAWWGFSFL